MADEDKRYIKAFLNRQKEYGSLISTICKKYPTYCVQLEKLYNIKKSNAVS